MGTKYFRSVDLRASGNSSFCLSSSLNSPSSVTGVNMASMKHLHTCRREEVTEVCLSVSRSNKVGLEVMNCWDTEFFIQELKLPHNIEEKSNCYVYSV